MPQIHRQPKEYIQHKAVTTNIHTDPSYTTVDTADTHLPRTNRGQRLRGDDGTQHPRNSNCAPRTKTPKRNTSNPTSSSPSVDDTEGSPAHTYPSRSSTR
jgi:hypothetical protein